MESWRTLSRRTILNYSKLLRVEEHQIELPDGQRIDDWPWVITPDYVNVVAITEAGAFLCFRQTKYGISGVTTAIVGGYLEPGEEPLAAAQRELLEETGFAGEDWQSLGSFVVDANRGCGTAYFFLARGVRPVAAPDADDLEEQELLLLSRAEVEEALAANAFTGLPYAATLALALLTLDREAES